MENNFFNTGITKCTTCEGLVKCFKWSVCAICKWNAWCVWSFAEDKKIRKKICLKTPEIKNQLTLSYVTNMYLCICNVLWAMGIKLTKKKKKKEKMCLISHHIFLYIRLYPWAIYRWKFPESQKPYMCTCVISLSKLAPCAS